MRVCLYVWECGGTHVCECVHEHVFACLFRAILDSALGVLVLAVSSEQGDPELRAYRLIQKPGC